MEELGIVEEEKQKLIKRYSRQGNADLLKKARSIESAEDLFELL